MTTIDERKIKNLLKKHHPELSRPNNEWSEILSKTVDRPKMKPWFTGAKVFAGAVAAACLVAVTFSSQIKSQLQSYGLFTKPNIIAEFDEEETLRQYLENSWDSLEFQDDNEEVLSWAGLD